MEKKVLCLAVGLSPAVQKTIIFPSIKKGGVNRSTRYYTDASGKCINVWRVLRQGGMATRCLTIAGRENAKEFCSMLDKDGLVPDLVEISGRVRTCTTLIEEETGTFTELVVNEPETMSSEEDGQFRELFDDIIDTGLKALVISGSRIKGSSDHIIPYMVERAKTLGLLVVADYRGTDLHNSYISETVRPDVVKINEEEFVETFGSFPSLNEGLVEVSKKYGASIVISRGELSTLGAENGKLFEVESHMVEAANPIGCGDSMTAGITQGLLEGKNLKEAVELGRDYATRNVTNIRPGRID